MKSTQLLILLSWIISNSSSNHSITEQGFLVVDSRKTNVYPNRTDFAYFIPTKRSKNTFDTKNLKKGYFFSQNFGPVMNYRNNLDTLCDNLRCLVYLPAKVTYRRPGLGFDNKYKNYKIIFRPHRNRIKLNLSTERIILEAIEPL